METPYPFHMFWDQFSQLSTLLYLSELSLTPTHPSLECVHPETTVWNCSYHQTQCR